MHTWILSHVLVAVVVWLCSMTYQQTSMTYQQTNSSHSSVTFSSSSSQATPAALEYMTNYKGTQHDTWLRKRYTVKSINDLVCPLIKFPIVQCPPTYLDDKYFHKYDDLQGAIKKAGSMYDGNFDELVNNHGKINGRKPMPGKLFSLLDLLEWDQELKFLKCKNALLLFEDNPAKKLVKANITVYSYMEKKKPTPTWGDLHFPLSVHVAGGFDLVYFSQTIEHLYDPVLCLRNLYDVMAPGGYIFTTVPLLSKMHMKPTFFSLPTIFGMIVWFDTAGFVVDKVGQLGNLEMLNDFAYSESKGEENKWPIYEKYVNKSTGRLENDKFNPIQGWILAHKPK